MSSNPEDTKLQVLASATKTRSGATSAAALRDSTGRTYVAIPVLSGDFSVDALQAVLVVAKASQIQGIEAVVVAGVQPSTESLNLIRGESPSALILWVNTENQLISL
ncbi:MAG: cytidine deaminase [Actinomycetes bacterium]